MRNVLIFACLAGIASAVAIYFVSESDKREAALEDEYSDDMGKNDSGLRRGFDALG